LAAATEWGEHAGPWMGELPCENSQKFLPIKQKVSFPILEKLCQENKKYVLQYTKNNLLTPLLGGDCSQQPNPWHWIGSGQ
jgi:hypothetical protein